MQSQSRLMVLQPEMLAADGTAYTANGGTSRSTISSKSNCVCVFSIKLKAVVPLPPDSGAFTHQRLTHLTGLMLRLFAGEPTENHKKNAVSKKQIWSCTSLMVVQPKNLLDGPLLDSSLCNQPHPRCVKNPVSAFPPRDYFITCSALSPRTFTPTITFLSFLSPRTSFIDHHLSFLSPRTAFIDHPLSFLSPRTAFIDHHLSFLSTRSAFIGHHLIFLSPRTAFIDQHLSFFVPKKCVQRSPSQLSVAKNCFHRSTSQFFCRQELLSSITISASLSPRTAFIDHRLSSLSPGTASIDHHLSYLSSRTSLTDHASQPCRQELLASITISVFCRQELLSSITLSFFLSTRTAFIDHHLRFFCRQELRSSITISACCREELL